MLLRILLDAYKLFDRRWRLILAAVAISVGLSDVVGLVLSTKFHLPTIILPSLSGSPLKLNYSDLIQDGLSTLMNYWFMGFVAFLALAEIENRKIRFLNIAVSATTRYPKILAVNVVAQVIMFFSFLLLLPALAVPILGIIFMIPAILLIVWFSLITPVAVMDNFHRIRDILIRSRMLVHGYFWTILVAMLISLVPLFATLGFQTSTIYYWLLTTFIHLAIVILGALIIVSAYANLRIAKGEKLTAKLDKNTEEQAEEPVDA